MAANSNDMAHIPLFSPNVFLALRFKFFFLLSSIKHAFMLVINVNVKTFDGIENFSAK